MIPATTPPASPADLLGIARDAVTAAAGRAWDALRSKVRGMADDAAFGRGYDAGAKAATRRIAEAGGVAAVRVDRIIDREGAIGGMVVVADEVRAERHRLVTVFDEGLADARANQDQR